MHWFASKVGGRARSCWRRRTTPTEVGYGHVLGTSVGGAGIASPGTEGWVAGDEGWGTSIAGDEGTCIAGDEGWGTSTVSEEYVHGSLVLGTSTEVWCWVRPRKFGAGWCWVRRGSTSTVRRSTSTVRRSMSTVLGASTCIAGDEGWGTGTFSEEYVHGSLRVRCVFVVFIFQFSRFTLDSLYTTRFLIPNTSLSISLHDIGFFLR